jgi:hypothetical protein
MNYFWGGVTVLVLAAIAIITLNFGLGSFGNDNRKITFADIETECRMGGENSEVSLHENRLRFMGNFPYDENDANLGYTYRESGDRITLNVKSSGGTEPTTFLNDCLGDVVYDGTTQPISDGIYLVQVRHNGDLQNSQYIRIN